jgi:hypothetical protein
MVSSPNALRWKGRPGHYEVYYLTLTDPRAGVGVWIRYTMLAPEPPSTHPASCSLWFLAMDPRPGAAPTLARKVTYPVELMGAQADPFELRIGDARLDDHGMEGAFEDVSWDLRWASSGKSYAPVNPILHRLGVAKTALVVPHPDLSIDGELTIAGERIELSGARGGQAHVWGSEHASSWAWVHCNDLRTLDGEPVPGAFVDGVSATVPRFGRELGPSTPVVGRIGGADFRSTSPLRILANSSTYALTGWRFEAVHGARKLVGEVDAVRDQLAGVIYHDPDGEPAYCYNSETASLRLHLYERARQVGGWAHTTTLVAPGRAHFEYAQRTPVPEIALLIR